MEWAVDMYTYDVSVVSKTSSIVELNIVDIWCLCGRGSKFLWYISKVVMYFWICFNFDSSMMYLPVRLFVFLVSSCNRKFSLLIWRALRCSCGYKKFTQTSIKYFHHQQWTQVSWLFIIIIHNTSLTIQNIFANIAAY